MKTIAKTLIAAIALLFAMQINAAPINGGPISSTNEIQYSVKINSTQIHSGSFNLNLFVMITDEHGRLVAPVQAVRPGLSTYHFSEFGPVIGTRVARLIYDPIGPTDLPFYCAPDVKTGKFINGTTYLFNLYPTTNPPKREE
jgi:hypothetical protein